MRRHAPPMLVLAVLTATYLWPLSVAPRRLAMNAADTACTMWVLVWGARQLVRDPLHLWDGNIFAPHPKSFAYTDTILGDAPFSVPLYAATGDPVLTYNVVLTIVFFLTAATAYALAYDIVEEVLPALFVGVAFGFASYRAWNIDTINLCSIQYLPLALLCLRRALRSADAPRRAGWWLLAFAVSFVMNALCSWYYAFMLAVAAPFFAIPLMPRTRAGIRRLLLPAAVGALVTAALTLGAAWPYIWLHRHLEGFVRDIDQVRDGSAQLSDYAARDPASTLERWRDGFRLDAPLADGPEPSFDRKIFMRPLPFFPGVLVLALVPFSFVHGRASRSTRLSLLAVAATGLVLSLGPYQHWFQRDVPMPYLFLYRHVPGWQALRWVSRFSLLLQLAFAILAAHGLAWLRARAPLAGRPRLATAVLLGASLLTFAEKLTLPLHLTTVPSTIPPVYGYLEALPPNAIFVEAPILKEALYTYYAAIHWRRMAGGFDSWQPDESLRIRAALKLFPSRRLWELLRASDVTHLVMHYHFLRAPRPDLRAKAATSPYFREAASFGDDVVYEVLTAPRATGEPAAQAP